jgi:hypothetical protein
MDVNEVDIGSVLVGRVGMCEERRPAPLTEDAY